MKLYLAGPMRGIPEFNFPNFIKGTEALHDLGHDVFNPAQRDIDTGFNVTGLDGNEDLSDMGFNLREALHDDLCYIAMTADAVVVLPGWEQSKGVAAELATAKALSIPAIDIDTFLDKEPETVEEARLLATMVPLDMLPARESFKPVPESTFNFKPVDGLPFSPYLAGLLQKPSVFSEAEDQKSYDVWPDTAPKGEQGPADEITAEEYEHHLTINTGGLNPSSTAEAVHARISALDGEVRTTSSTGGQKGMKLARFDLIPAGALTTLAEHYGRGAEKYDDNQWRNGYEWSKSYAALVRHLTAFWDGENIDPETGSPHMAAVAWHAFTLLTFMQEYPQHDDRYFKEM